MKGKPHLRILGLCLLPVMVFGSEEPVVAVLSSKSAPYQQALDGFQKAFGHPVPSFTLSEGEPDIPAGTRIVVAFGGKATFHSYPEKSILIYCLAPGTKIGHDVHAGPLLKIHTNPSVDVTISKFKELQPSLKRLAVIWAGDSIQDYFDQRKEIRERLGVDMISDRITNSDSLPDHLRALKGKVDAIWLPPDAATVTPKNFATIKEFTLSNGLPFYVPSEGLVEQGATAAISSSFTEIGALAAAMVRKAQNGSLDTDHVFPEEAHVFINLTAAARSGLTIPTEVLKKADRVIP